MVNLTIGKTYTVVIHGINVGLKLLGSGERVDLESIMIDLVAEAPSRDYDNEVLFFRTRDGYDVDGKILNNNSAAVTLSGKECIINL